MIRRGVVLEIYALYPKSFGSNCYILVSNGSAAVIDPSVDATEITSLAQSKGAVIEKIILTHGHFDHIESLDKLRDMTQSPACIHKHDNEMLTDGNKNAHSLFFGYNKKWRPAEILLEDSDEISLGGETIKVISTPGHSKGSICLLCGDKLITGDTLFANGYGRYDLHGGDVNALTSSLNSLRELDQKLTIYPGHGAPSILGTALDELLYF
jgi:glyoxylase-like metal-dependent hydrolase (beta-lactamase superfamily II)